MDVLDVGCGPGALSERLAGVVGAERLAAVDPSESFVAACSERVPGADVRRSAAEQLPWEDDAFDAALSQLVVNFMRDAPAGASEMRRVARPGGVAAACTWDYGDGMEMLRAFWAAARTLDAAAPDEGRTMRYRSTEELAELWRERRLGGGRDRLSDRRARATPASTTSGSRSRSASALPARTARRSSPGGGRSCASRLFENVGSPAGSFSLGARACAVRGAELARAVAAEDARRGARRGSSRKKAHHSSLPLPDCGRLPDGLVDLHVTELRHRPQLGEPARA